MAVVVRPLNDSQAWGRGREGGGLSYRAIHARLACVFSTDGRISRRSIVEVEDIRSVCKINRGWKVDNNEGKN